METKDIFFLVAIVSIAGFSLYRKYMKKKEAGDSRADDYEPYSGKK